LRRSMLEEGAVVVTVRATDVALVGLAGVNVHVAPVGRPEQV